MHWGEGKGFGWRVQVRYFGSRLWVEGLGLEEGLVKIESQA